MLPHVIRFNAKTVGGLYGRLAADLELCAVNDPTAGDLLADKVRSMTRVAGLPTSLRQCSVDKSELPKLAEEASRQWTGTFNPRPVNTEILLELYDSAFDD
jgi:alcohol dehydrogenase